MSRPAEPVALGAHAQPDASHDKVSKTRPAEGRKKEKRDAATGVSAASARTFAARAVAFYFYMAFARAINPQLQANEAWSWRTTTPGILNHAVQTHGWSFIPKYVLPPLFANVLVGSVLYTSYLTTLSILHAPSSTSSKRQYPPPPPSSTFAAGFFAGTLQSLVASPVDALHVRYKTAEMLAGRYKDMWQYAYQKTREIGLRGIFAGWTLSFLKDSFGCAVFFTTFESIKSQGFYAFVKWYYADMNEAQLKGSKKYASYELHPDNGGVPTIRPHFALEPAFLLLAGVSASLTQALVQYPLGLIQDIHYSRLDILDTLHSKQEAGRRNGASRLSTRETLRNYRHAYAKTRRQCELQARRAGGSLLRWAYKGFIWNTLRSMPSTSAGLVIFELVRRRYADKKDEVRIRVDGWDVLLV